MTFIQGKLLEWKWKDLSGDVYLSDKSNCVIIIGLSDNPRRPRRVMTDVKTRFTKGGQSGNI